MSIIIVKGTRSSRSVTKIKEIICCKKWASSKTNDVHNTPEKGLHKEKGLVDGGPKPRLSL
jgi:hypothetical protein